MTPMQAIQQFVKDNASKWDKFQLANEVMATFGVTWEVAALCCFRYGIR